MFFLYTSITAAVAIIITTTTIIITTTTIIILTAATILRHEGDNQLSSLRLPCVADRVSLGLLPSADAGIPLAVHVMRERGGCMHVHGNCLDTQEGIR